MRPAPLFPLFTELESLPGVGPRTAERLNSACGGNRLRDLLFTLPSGLIDRRASPSPPDFQPGVRVTLIVKILRHKFSKGRNGPSIVETECQGTQIDLCFFSARAQSLEKTYPLHTEKTVSGQLENFRGRWQIIHPERTGPTTAFNRIARQEPVYPLVAGLFASQMEMAQRAASTKIPELAEWHDPHLLARQHWPTWKDSLIAAHTPQAQEDLSSHHPARQRLAYDELLSEQLALTIVRQQEKRQTRTRELCNESLRQSLRSALPFTLTEDQEQALAEIDQDLGQPQRMIRLLQGDVGSGKTIVALLTMLRGMGRSGQAALLAPTEILARQHFANFKLWLAPLGLKPVLLLGQGRGQDSTERRKNLQELAEGSARLIIGTHALLQSDVKFHNLSLIVVDEQHRFGVAQRLALAAKANAPDVLVMTATPIPRSLCLTAYGDLDISAIRNRPPGRALIDTRLIPLARREEIYAGLGRALQSGAQAYWVCPLVEEDPESPLIAARTRYADLQRRFGKKVGLLHGKMKSEEKTRTMQAFLDGTLRILVATTVIEVGVDVPNASIMIIEQAEHFGLAQLHQLRGRVGRGTVSSRCLLLYTHPATENARSRLRILRETNDGFHIAEEDLKLRGAGEILGTLQSGTPEYHLARLPDHQSLAQMAQKDARLILQQDAELKSERGRALRLLLYLFEQDSAIHTLHAG